jgi:hypothetical protein
MPLLIHVMAEPAQCLPVVRVPEQRVITSVWFDVIDHQCPLRGTQISHRPFIDLPSGQAEYA